MGLQDSVWDFGKVFKKTRLDSWIMWLANGILRWVVKPPKML